MSILNLFDKCVLAFRYSKIIFIQFCKFKLQNDSRGILNSTFFSIFLLLNVIYQLLLDIFLELYFYLDI